VFNSLFENLEKNCEHAKKAEVQALKKVLFIDPKIDQTNLMEDHSVEVKKVDQTRSALTPLINDELTFRFHTLVRNPRCAALALKAIDEELDSVSRSLRAQSSGESPIHSFLTQVAQTVVREFCLLNGLGDKKEQAPYFIGKAIGIVRDHHSALTAEDWEDLAVKCGLITDNARWIGIDEYNKGGYKKVESKSTAPSTAPQTQVLAFKNGTPRFALSEAAVAIFLLRLTPTLSSISSAVHWSLFELVTADYLVVSAAVPKVNQTVQTNTSTSIFSLPRDVFVFPAEQTTRRCSLSFKFEKGISDVNLASVKKEIGNCVDGQNRIATVFINGDKASGADVFAVAPGLIFLVQCKYLTSSSLTTDDALAEFQKMEGWEMENVPNQNGNKSDKWVGKKEDLSLLAHLAECCLAGTTITTDTKVRVVSVILCLKKENIKLNDDMILKDQNLVFCPKKKILTSGKKPGKDQVSCTIQRRICCVFDGDVKSNLASSNLYPVMNMPFQPLKK
jgi:hypothetical protein